jgi:hypothetical protein
MATPVINFGKVTVSTTYGSADVTIVLTTGHGSRLPSTFPYPLTWWDATTYSDPADDPSRELVTVTGRTGDTLTITRASEGTSASAKNTGGKTYKMVLGITAAMYNGLFDQSLGQDFRGLLLQTHPNSDVAAKKVQLIHADAIVMDDGLEVSGWDDVAADVTASGVGGLDTSTELASTWYEIYAIYNGTTKSLLLHRAKDYFLDESQVVNDNSYPLRRATDVGVPLGTNLRIAQGFTVNVAGPIEFVDVVLQKAGTPTGNIWFTLQANSGGVPSDTALTTSDIFDVARMSVSANWVRVPFRTPYSVSSATTYHLVMHGDYTQSNTNNVTWGADVGGAGYANGSASWSNHVSTAGWTSIAGDDFTFKIYVTENNNAVTMPSGYTLKALIGYVYNNASSNFKHFAQVDRIVSCGNEPDWNTGSFTVTTPVLVDLFAFVPPIPVVVVFARYNATASHGTIGDIVATNLTAVAGNEQVGSARSTNVAGYHVHYPSLVLSPYQGMVQCIGAGTDLPYLLSFTW